MSKQALLEVKNLSKHYRDFRAVNDVTFTVHKGEAVGLLGPNGAGKSTSIHMLLGLIKPTAGDIFYFGHNFKDRKYEILQRINYASAYNYLQGRVTVVQNLNVFARLYNIKHPDKKIRELSEYFRILDLFDQQFYSLSAGQRTRVTLVKAFLNDPEILLMDEPTASLDPDIADKTLELIENLKKDKDVSILFTSHNMQEVTRICDNVVFLKNGAIVAQDTPANLTKMVSDATLILTFNGALEELKDYLEKTHLTYTFPEKNKLVINIEEQYIPKTLFQLGKTGIYIEDIEIKKPDLEDVFLHIARTKNYAQ